MTDQLLEWMSFRSTGRTDDIPSQLTAGFAIRKMVNDFSMLGHLELTGSEAWRIAPPVLAGLPEQKDQNPAAILCGARTPGVLASLSSACQSTEAQMTLTPLKDQPTVIRVNAPSKAILASAAETGRLTLQHNTALALLACSPAIRNWPRTPCAMVAGKVEKVRRFSRSKIGWVDSSLAEAAAAKAGFFRIKRDWDWVSLLKTGVSECAYIDDRAGCLFAASKLKTVLWSRETGTLSLPHQLLPPGIIARALTLCTGQLPEYDAANQRIAFTGLTQEILTITLAITGLRLA